MGPLFFRPMMASLKAHSLDAPFKTVKVVKARLGKNVGVLGAAAACF
jgi:hypothetical protein